MKKKDQIKLIDADADAVIGNGINDIRYHSNVTQKKYHIKCQKKNYKFCADAHTFLTSNKRYEGASNIETPKKKMMFPE